MLNLSKISLVFSLSSLALFTACTDYVAQMEDDFEDWKKLQAELYEIETQQSSSSAVQDDDEILPGSSAKLSSSKKASSSSAKAKSSSSVKKGSSSSAKPSSSAKASSVVKGTFKDKRDNVTYETVTIGSQTWFAENLTYNTEEIGGYCYENKSANCDKYGRLYTWYDANNVCPSGWHLPTKAEFETLIATVGGVKTAGKVLKSTSIDWLERGFGTDKFGFSALPGGFRDIEGKFDSEGAIAHFWSATAYGDGNEAYYLYILGESDEANVLWNEYTSKDLALSVRCLKGEAEKPKSSSSKTVSSSSKTVSSSSVKASSSSKVESSSSEAKSSNSVLQSDFEDPRDGKSYRTVNIGKQQWMVDNLNFKTDNSYCLDDDLFNCNKYGRLYTWDEAIEVCPDGWRLPTKVDFETLVATAGGESVAARKLKATFGWDDDNGTDEFGFMSLPSGARDVDGFYYDLKAEYWSSIEYWGLVGEFDGSAYSMSLSKNDADVYVIFWGKTAGFSVRCIKGGKVKPGSMKDPRDGQVYKTVTLGTQTWMAQNMNYMSDEIYGFYGTGISDYREEFGLLYPWYIAQDVCPSGWHLPSFDEWNELYKFVGADAGGDSTLVGSKLKDRYSWSEGKGLDDYGFSAKAAGFSKDDILKAFGEGSFFWSSTLNDNESAVFLYMRKELKSFYASVESNLDVAVSVRCLKD